MITDSLFQVLILLPAQKTQTVLWKLNEFAGIEKSRATLSTDNADVLLDIQDNPSWLSLLDTKDLLISWKAEGILQGVVERLTFALLNGAGVLVLNNMPEAMLDQLRQGLFDIHLQCELYDRTRREAYVFAIPQDSITERRMSSHSALIRGAAYSPDGRTILTTGGGTATIWGAATGKEHTTLSGDAQYSFDGRGLMTLGGRGQVKLWDTQTWQERITIETGVDNGLPTLSPDGTSFCTVTADYNHYGTVIIEVWDSQTGKRHLWISGVPLNGPHNNPIYSPDGKHLAAIVNGGIVQLWDIPTGRLLFSLPGRTVLYHPDGNSIFTINDDFTATIWDTQTGQPRVTWHDQTLTPDTRADDSIGGPSVYALNGTYIVTTDLKGNIKVWDSQTGQEVQHITGYSWAVFSPDGKSIAVFPLFGQQKQIVILDAKTGQELLAAPGVRIGYSPDGSHILITNIKYERGEIAIAESKTECWKVLSGRKLFSLEGRLPEYYHEDGVNFKTFPFDNPVISGYGPDGRTILTVLPDGRAKLWDGQTGQLRATLGEIRILVHTRTGWGAVTGKPEVGDVATVQRFAEVQSPEQARSEQIFAISVGLVRQASSELLDAEPVHVQATIDAEGQSTGAKPVTVTLYADAFDLLDSNRMELHVYAEKDTPPVSLHVKSKPGVNGPHAIYMVFYQGWECLGQVVAVIHIEPDSIVVGQTDTWKGYMKIRSSIEQQEGQRIDPPDVVLYISRHTHQGRDTLHYAYEWIQQGWPRREAGKVELYGSVDEWVEERYRALGRFASTESSSDSNSQEIGLRHLEKIGENLYYDLFTPELQAFYKQCASTARSLLVYSDEPWIPWEVVKPWGYDMEDELSDFLCTRFQFARWYTGPHGQRVKPTIHLRQLSAVIPPVNLLAIRAEEAYLRTLQQQWPPVTVLRLVPREAREVLSLMSKGTTHLFHFATHGSRQQGTLTVGAIALGRESLYVTDIVGAEVARGLRASSPFIFMNACHTSRRSQGLHLLEGWADRFITFGCTGFVGANWEVLDDLASDFAIHCYEALRSGKTIAQAVQQARIRLKEANPANSTWLAYSLYAHPNLKIRTLDS